MNYTAGSGPGHTEAWPTTAGSSTRTPTPKSGRIRDLRDGTVDRLVYPPYSLLLVAGIPGAGKTTLLRRLYGLTGRERNPVRTSPDGVVVVDSEQARNWWAAHLSRVPYRCWRPLVHLTHYLRIWRALAQHGPVVAHECGTRPRLFAILVRRAAHHQRDVNVLLLDTPPAVAFTDAQNRPRPLHVACFRRHARRWRRLLGLLDSQPRRALPDARTIILLDRPTADRLCTVDFSSAGTRQAPR